MTDPADTCGHSLRIGVLISGSGSNLQALLDHCASGFIPGQVALVISNNPVAFGLERAQRCGIPARVVNHGDFANRLAFDRALITLLDEAEIQLVCLAGFMRVLSGDFVRHFQGRLLNIHPALLPAFPGLHVQRQALEAGVRFSGATVHFVEEEVDAGPIVMQGVVPVLPDDDEATLAARILRQEHRIYPQAVRLFAQNRLRIQGRRVEVLAEQINPDVALLNPPWEG